MDPASTRRIRHDGAWMELIELPSIFIRVIEGPDERLTQELPVELVRIGTDPGNDLVLTDPGVSRFHLTITRTPDGLLASDLGSTNGTFLEGARIREGFLQAGSMLRLGSSTLRIEDRRSSHPIPPPGSIELDGLVGGSPAMAQVRSLIEGVARSPITVLIEGETGTGKEVVAHAIHAASGRTGDLIIFDCGSIQKDLIQAELFGHREGAFTGAGAARSGACRSAHQGTLFIDEIGELPLGLQPTLLVFLERREVKPLGSDRPTPVDVRMVAATNVDLQQAVARREFRADLYHRLKVVKVRLPPLRERLEDVPLLIEHFCRTLACRLEFTPAAQEMMSSYEWPGNVRELRHLVERLAVFCKDRPVTPGDLELETPPAPATPPCPVEDLTSEVILEALDKHRWNRDQAASTLGISRSTLFRRMKEFGIKDDH